MEEAIDPLTGTLRDLRIDDRDLPLAKNFFEFSTKFCAANPPWARQMLLYTNLFGEWCPTCTNPKFLDLLNVPVDFPTEDLPGDISFLEYGKCPKCGTRKSQLVRDGRMRLYQELVLVWGQRCVVGGTVVLTENGPTRIGDLAKNAPYGFSPMNLGVHNGKNLEKTSKFFRAKPEPLLHVRMSNGSWIEGTVDHPIKIIGRGFVKLSELKSGDLTAIRINQQVFGKSVPNVVNIIRNVRNDRSIKSPYEAKFCITPSFTTNVARLLGLWVAEGYGHSLTCTDESVLNDAYTAFKDIFHPTRIRRSDNSVSTIGKHSAIVFAQLMGLDFKDLYRKSALQSIPATIMNAPKEYQTEFLRGLFEGDGSVGYNSKGTPVISYTTISEQLALDLYCVLSNLGIYTTIRHRKTWATNGTSNQISKNSYTLRIRGGVYVRRYWEQIGFISCRKNSYRAEHERFETTKKVPHNYENLPFLREKVVSMIEEIRAITSIKKAFEGTTIWKIPSDPNRAITKDKIESIITVMENLGLPVASNIKKMIASDVVFIRVQSIVDMDARETFDFTLPKTHQFVANGIINHNSGKSLTGSMALAYQTHRFLKLPRLADLWPQGIQKFTPLTGTLVSLTFGKAVGLLWAPYMSILNQTPWFADYHAFLDHWGNHYGTELYRKKDLFIKYWHKNLHMYPSHPNASILRGDTRLLGAIDELGLFNMPKDMVSDEADETSERANAKEAINSLESSMAQAVQACTYLVTERGMDHVPHPLLLGLSSPKHIRDMVMRRYRLSQTEDGRKIFLGSHMATWEINPTLPRDSAFIRGKFLSDPIGAMRDFGAQPPRTTNTFVPPTHFTKEKYPFVGAKNTIRMEYEYSAEEVWGILKNAVPNKNKFPTVLSMDAGQVNNSFAITAVGIDPDSEYKVRAPAIIEIIPREGLSINFNRVYKNILVPFSKAMNSQIWLADRWGSVELLSRAKDEIEGLQVRQKTLRITDFENFLQVLWNANLVLPELSKDEAREVRSAEIEDYRQIFYEKPIHHLMHQFLTVQTGAGGSTPEKAHGFTDDVFRALVLGVYGITNTTILDIVNKNRVNYGNSAATGGGLVSYVSRSSVFRRF